MPPKLEIIETQGRIEERAGKVREEIMDIIDEHCAGMPIVAVVGLLEIVKIDLLENQKED